MSSLSSCTDTISRDAEPLASECAREPARDPGQDPYPDHDDPEALLPDALPDLEPELEEEDELCFVSNSVVIKTAFDCAYLESAVWERHEEDCWWCCLWCLPHPHHQQAWNQ